MKKTIKYPKKYPKKFQDDKNYSEDSNKKTVSIEDNQNTITKFFRITSKHKSTSVVPMRQKDKIAPNKNYTLSKYKFGKQKKKQNAYTKKILKKKKNNNDNNNNKIDISKYVFFSEKYCEEIQNIFENNFIRNFNSYLEANFKNDNKNIEPKFDINIQIFQNFIIKYLLNTYNDLIYVSKKYMTDTDKNNENENDEIELLSHDEKKNINFEYSPINILESNLFYPELCSNVVDFINNFQINKKVNCALLLYRPNNDFITYIDKIQLICDQKGYNLLVREDEANKLMSFEKIKLINQNYIIGSLKDKNKKYLDIIEAVSNTDKWKKFIEENDIYSLVDEDQKNNIRDKRLSRSQITIHSTKNLSSKIINNKNKGNNILSNTILTFIGHDSKEIKSQANNEDNNSKEFNIAQNYQQNILEKFNKRKNLILFVDNFEENEDNIKYINQINSLIPNSRSPIIILTNNLSLFTNNLIIGNKSFQTRYNPYLIENEGINQKENVIYLTFLIMYFISFFPNFKLKKKNILNKNLNDSDIINNLSVNLEKINIDSNNDDSRRENEKNENILELIKKSINDIFANINLNTVNNALYSSLITLAHIITIINNYELDNILVYLKNLFLFSDMELKKKNITDFTDIILSLQNQVLKEIEEYRVNDDIYNDDLLKLNDKYELYSFSDYEYGVIDNIGEKQYKSKIINYGINKDVDFNKESFFYINEFYDDYKDNQIFNYISNKELNERIIEDYKFYHNYLNSSTTILNHSDTIKINIILIQIISEPSLSIKDKLRFFEIKKNKTINFQSQNMDSNNNLKEDKISVLNKIFSKCPSELFKKYINAHMGFKYYIKFFIDNNTYYIPDKLLFYNYYNYYYLMEQINPDQNSSDYEEDENEEEESDEEEE